MKNKRMTFFLVGFLVFFSLSAFAETTKIRSVGQHPFVKIKGDVQTQEVMKTLVDQYVGDIKYGFDLAGADELFYSFIEQLKSETFVEKSLPVGDRLMWMLFRSQGKVNVIKDIEWAGKAPLEVFSFNVEMDHKAYEFVMPKPCGNISLRSITALEIPPIPQADCALSVSPAEIDLHENVTVDMSGSRNAKSMEADVFGPDGQKLTTLSLTPDSPKKMISFDQPGVYTFMGRAMNEKGEISTNMCEAKVTVIGPAAPPPPVQDVSAPKRLFFLVEGGPGLLRGTYTTILWARAGVLYKIVPDTLDFIFSLGGGVPLVGNEKWTSFVMGNALLNVHLGQAYLAGGLGFSGKEQVTRKGGIDLVGEVGVNLFKVNSSVGSVFFELRAPVLTSERSFAHHHKFLLGFRFIL